MGAGIGGLGSGASSIESLCVAERTRSLSEGAVGMTDVGRSGCCTALAGGLGGCVDSKLNGLRSSLGGVSGKRGDISWSLGLSGWRVGEGVISGVMVSTSIPGMGGAGL